MIRRLIPFALLFAAPAMATPKDLRSIAGMQSHNRVLIVFTPSLHDPRLTTQREIMARIALDAAARDLVLVQVGNGQVIGAHDQADTLYRHFHIAPGLYRTLLIGKDGRTALESAGPVDAATIMRTIDAMPMRQEEVRRARAGKPQPEPKS